MLHVALISLFVGVPLLLMLIGYAISSCERQRRRRAEAHRAQRTPERQQSDVEMVVFGQALPHRPQRNAQPLPNPADTLAEREARDLQMALELSRQDMLAAGGAAQSPRPAVSI